MACATQAPEEQGQGKEESAASAPITAPQQAMPSSPARLKAALRAPQAARALIRPLARSYEVEVQSPAGFSPRAIDPVLRIGDKEFSTYKESPSVGEYGAVFQVEKADFDALADASLVAVGYGPRAMHTTFGRLDKRALAVR
jgi:hypothetical protein